MADALRPGHTSTLLNLTLTIPSDQLRRYKFPAAFVKGTCAIIITFDDMNQHRGLAASELDFEFWPNVQRLAMRILNRCVGQGHGRLWGGFAATGVPDPTEDEHPFKVMVEGWVYNIYTPSGKLEA